MSLSIWQDSSVSSTLKSRGVDVDDEGNVTSAFAMIDHKPV
jgi:hypothetical protein